MSGGSITVGNPMVPMINGVIEIVRQQTLTVDRWTARFFDGHEESGDTYEECDQRAMTYSLEKMSRFGWHIYQRERWRFEHGRANPADPETGLIPDVLHPELVIRSELGLVHNDRDCEARRIAEDCQPDIGLSYTPEATSHIVTFHVSKDLDSYVERYLCEPCAHALFVSLGEVSGPGAWEYR
jgi:hypothetical protein